MQYFTNMLAPNAPNTFGAPNDVLCNLPTHCTNCTNELGVGALVHVVQPIDAANAQKNARSPNPQFSARFAHPWPIRRKPQVAATGADRMRDAAGRRHSRGNVTP